MEVLDEVEMPIKQAIASQWDTIKDNIDIPDELSLTPASTNEPFIMHTTNARAGSQASRQPAMQQDQRIIY